MLSIGKYFSGSKKRDFSDNSTDATDPNKAKEATSSSSYSDHDFFEEGLDSSSYRSILFDCLKNLESKVNEISETQIKRTKLKVKINSQISLKQLIFFRKIFMNLKPIGSSKKK